MSDPIAISGSALADVPTPCFVIDRAALQRNAQRLHQVQQESGAKILLALKGYAAWATFPILKPYLAGCTCSGLHEALLAHEKFGGEVHVYSPAYTEREVESLRSIADHMVFNSLSQWERFAPQWSAGGPSRGLRLNPEHREVDVALYDPCAPGSRLGVTAETLKGTLPEGIEGLHFHTLCELNSDALARTLLAVEERFEFALRDPRVKWINFGGGHHITRDDYDVARLVKLIQSHRQRYGHDVYLEPGEAVALNAGVLIASVLDVVSSGEVDIAILDTSATAHMPDVLEMPYRPAIEGAAEPGVKKHTFRLGGLTCLAGDVIGDYSFDQPLRVGDRLVFGDMAHYSMVKTTTFNGVPLPSIALHDAATGETQIVRRFGYGDYRDRLS